MTERLPVGPVLVALGAVVGCLGGSRVVPAAAVLLAVGAVGGAAVVFGPTRVVGVAVVVAIAGAAALASARAHDGVRRSALTEGVARGETVTLTGTAVDDADSGPFWAAVLVRVAAGSGHRTVLLRATGSEAMRLAPVRSGDHLVFGGRLGPLRTGGDHRARLRHAVARVEGSRLLALAPPSGLRAAVEALRARVLLGIERIAPTDHGLVAGFLLGETRAVPADVVAAYRAAGLSHLLAVSGANVAFVLAVVAPLLRRLGLGARTALALGVVVAFAVMTRGEPSVLRASALAAGSLVATAVGRPAARVRLLAYAVTALLLADPFLVRSPGFWLSVGASAGILVVAPALERRLPGSGVLRSALAVSIAAQVGVAPVLVMLAGSVPVAAPVANVLVAPVAELLGTAGLVLALLAGTFPVVGPVVAPFVGALVAWVSGTARVAASLPLALDRVGVAVVAAAVAAGASVACRRGSRAVPRAPAG